MVNVTQYILKRYRLGAMYFNVNISTHSLIKIWATRNHPVEHRILSSTEVQQ